MRISLLRIFKTLHGLTPLLRDRRGFMPPPLKKTFQKYLAYAFLWQIISLLQFLCYKQNIEKNAVMK